MTHLIKLSTAGILLATSTITFAFSAPHYSASVNIGYASPQSSNGFLQGSASNINKTTTKGALAYGANLNADWAVSPHFSVGTQVGYNTYGNATYRLDAGSGSTQVRKSAKYKTQAVDALLTSQYQFDSKWSAQAGIGAAYAMQTVDTHSIENTKIDSASTDTNKVLPMLSIGAAYHLTPALSMNLHGNYLFGKNESEGTSDASKPDMVAAFGIYAGLTYHFGVNTNG